MFAGIYGALISGLALVEVLLLQTIDQGLPAAGLLAAGVAAYAAGHSFSRYLGEIPQQGPLLGHTLFMAAVMMGMARFQPVLVDFAFGLGAPHPPMTLLPEGVVHGFLLATWFIALAAFRMGARRQLETASGPGLPDSDRPEKDGALTLSDA